VLPLVQALLLLLGIAGARYVDPASGCTPGPCADVPERPVVAWIGPQTVRSDEILLFSRGARRPGQPGESALRVENGRAPWIVGPARERVRDVLAREVFLRGHSAAPSVRRDATR
jgi:hypothetical protein